MMENTTTWDLIPIFDNAKSFYRKAYVMEGKFDNYTLRTLISYNTKVAQIYETDTKMSLELFDTDVCVNGEMASSLTRTTCRHINEFLQQNGYESMTVSEMRKLAAGE